MFLAGFYRFRPVNCFALISLFAGTWSNRRAWWFRLAQTWSGAWLQWSAFVIRVFCVFMRTLSVLAFVWLRVPWTFPISRCWCICVIWIRGRLGTRRRLRGSRIRRRTFSCPWNWRRVWFWTKFYWTFFVINWFDLSCDNYYKLATICDKVWIKELANIV